MAIMTSRDSVAANAVSANICAGKSAEFVQEESIVRLYAAASAVGLNATLVVGSEVGVDDQEVSAQNRMPLVPDDLIAEVGAFPGDRIILKWRNTTGGALTGFARIEVEPV